MWNINVRRWGVLYRGYLCEGSVVRKAILGFTRIGVENRLERELERQAT